MVGLLVRDINWQWSVKPTCLRVMWFPHVPSARPATERTRLGLFISQVPNGANGSNGANRGANGANGSNGLNVANGFHSYR